ncbi:MAG TPA: hypothetical protein VFD90_09880 [Gaiellales bacterium]|jgi:hypothetical protein|nr:hypothetical protein [Gaiellales bacterium]
MSSQGFDASTVKRSTWLAGGGAVVLLISTFLSWGKISLGPITLNVSGWDTGSLGKLVFFAALIATILVVVDFMKVDVSQMPIPVSRALVGTAAAGLLFVILRFLFMPDGLSRAWGLYLAIIAAAVLAYGAWMKLQEES